MDNGYNVSIGDTIWLFDDNRRVYADRKPGEAYTGSGPTYLGHWYPVSIAAETKRSWVTEHGRKIPKNLGSVYSSHAWSWDDVMRFDYINNHRHRIADMVRRCDNYRSLVIIADTLGYTPAGITPPTHKG